jgi:hypothetical protein
LDLVVVAEVFVTTTTLKVVPGIEELLSLDIEYLPNRIEMPFKTIWKK